ncbi:unnamed protein product, partial [Ixodes pacificus]
RGRQPGSSHRRGRHHRSRSRSRLLVSPDHQRVHLPRRRQLSSERASPRGRRGHRRMRSPRGLLPDFQASAAHSRFRATRRRRPFFRWAWSVPCPF